MKDTLGIDAYNNYTPPRKKYKVKHDVTENEVEGIIDRMDENEYVLDRVVAYGATYPRFLLIFQDIKEKE